MEFFASAVGVLQTLDILPDRSLNASKPIPVVEKIIKNP